jgi:DeoR family fructose operon transcriptional repressor
VALSERQKKILKLIRRERLTRVSELAQRFRITEASIRLDLGTLAELGLIRRFHGGANPVRESAYEQRLSENRQAKKRIAQRARQHVEEGDTLFLDSGTTVLLLSRLLADFERLTVVTNSIPIANQMGREQSNTVILAGGAFNFSEQCCEGPMTEKFLDNFYASKAFIGADSVDVHKGLFSNGVTMFSYVQKIIGNTRKTILLVDSSKFSKAGAIKICDLDQIQTVITDQAVPAEARETLISLGIQVEIV